MEEFAALTDPGARGGPNEDAIGWDLDQRLWFVADGMGGHAHGQDASRLVKETLLGLIGKMDLGAAVLKAHEVVRAAAAQFEGERAMGATVVCAQITDHTCRIIWVGDSRAYLWRRRALQRLTRDHSYLETLADAQSLSETEMRDHPRANVVLQTLGMGTPLPSERRVRLRRGDWIILCSDGIPVELRDSEMASILQSSENPQQAARQLLDGALNKGGRDNASVVVVQYTGKPAAGWVGKLAQLDNAAVGWISVAAGVMLAAVLAIVLWLLRLHR
jgi:serine/threonine protein phosphatase PrpC